ncbi:ABC transporter substrate-binding protein [Methanorbis rubei]|uniref:Vitamin B12-binding protein n=1 Tax=Methanorbis rubei TaxID=3028300 RepID=A0AAE4SBM3_9EURY|nr:Vitamin B12-binding protein [Methanocorpusculaceae archaeon Cs1]
MKYIFLIVLILCLFAGTVNAEEWKPVSIVDDYGYVSQISSKPETIVSLAPTNTEILFALGLGDKVVGVTEYCSYPEEARTKPIVGGYSTINIEKIVAQNPDIIFGNTLNGKENIEHLRELGFTVICLNPDSVSGTYSAISTIGSAAGCPDVAESYILSMQKKIDNVTQSVGNTTTVPSVAHMLSVDPYWVSGNSTFQNELIELAGGKNIFSDVNGWGVVNIERLITADPDIILVSSGSGMGEDNGNVLLNTLVSDPRLSQLSAIKSNRLFVVDSDTFNRGGPRIVDALEELSVIIPSSGSGSPTPTTASGFGGLVLCIALAGIFLRRK